MNSCNISNSLTEVLVVTAERVSVVTVIVVKGVKVVPAVRVIAIVLGFIVTV